MSGKKWMVGLLCLLAWAGIGRAQNSAPTGQVSAANPPTTAVPTWVTYRFFFMHLATLDAVANKMEAQKKDGSRWRTHEQRAVGLTADEAAILKTVALDCNKIMSDLDAKAQDVMKTAKAQNPTLYLKLPPPPDLTTIQDQRIQAVNDHIDQLRDQLGNDSFAKLDKYLQATFKSAIKAVPATAGSAR